MTARNTDRSPQGRRRTRVTLRDLRADTLHRLLLTSRGQIAALPDISKLPDLASWNPEAIDVAIGDLVENGMQYGRPHAVETSSDPGTSDPARWER